MRTAESIAHGRDNNFNLIRMLAASAVIVSHSYPLARGIGSPEPLTGWSPMSLGGAAVQVFFAISGFFILKSFERRNSFLEFAAARIARILPGLLVVWLVTTDLAVLGVNFTRAPGPPLINGAIWTLWFEGACYVVLAVAGLAGLYRTGRFGVFLVSFAIVYALLKTYFQHQLLWGWAYADLGLPFVLGMTAYRWRRWLPLDWRIAAPLFIPAYFSGTMPLWSLALGYAALWAGSAFPALRVYNRVGDYSYGTYIYGWPIQKLLALFIPGIGTYAMMALALPSAWTLGVISWRFVEQPSLDGTRRMARCPTNRFMLDMARKLRLPGALRAD